MLKRTKIGFALYRKYLEKEGALFDRLVDNFKAKIELEGCY